MTMLNEVKAGRYASAGNTDVAKFEEQTMNHKPTHILPKSCRWSLSGRQGYYEANRALRLSLQLLRPNDKPFGIRHKLLYCNLFNRSKGRWRLTIRGQVWEAAQADVALYHYSHTNACWVYMPSIDIWRQTGAWSSRCERLPKYG